MPHEGAVVAERENEEVVLLSLFSAAVSPALLVEDPAQYRKAIFFCCGVLAHSKLSFLTTPSYIN